MHTADLLALAVATVEALGYQARWEYLEGGGGGSCEIRGRKFLFVDLADNPAEQLASVLEVLSREASLRTLALPAVLAPLVARSSVRAA